MPVTLLNDLTVSQRAELRAAAIERLAAHGVDLAAGAHVNEIAHAISVLTGARVAPRGSRYELLWGLISGRYRSKGRAVPRAPAPAALIRSTGRPLSLASNPAMRIAAERARQAEPALRGLGSPVRPTEWRGEDQRW